MLNVKNTAIVLLASGLSSRFKTGDKLLAQIGEKSILETTSNRWKNSGNANLLAVVGTDQAARRLILENAGWQIIENDAPARGMGYSLALATKKIIRMDFDGFILALADMPFFSRDLPHHMVEMANNSSANALISSARNYSGPPALFKKAVFENLTSLDGDTGAKRILSSLHVDTIHLSEQEAIDIDTLEDLIRLS